MWLLAAELQITDYVLTGLVKRRSELAGAIEATHERLRKMIEDLEKLHSVIHGDAAIRPQACHRMQLAKISWCAVCHGAQWLGVSGFGLLTCRRPLVTDEEIELNVLGLNLPDGGRKGSAKTVPAPAT